METENSVPDLYELAFMPGQFRCPKCGFQWSIQTINVAQGKIGTTEENRQAPDCPNDGTRMLHVTYREQLEAYADRLKEELDNRDLEKQSHDAEIRRIATELGIPWPCSVELIVSGIREVNQLAMRTKF
jgi:hypothetical protein